MLDDLTFPIRAKNLAGSAFAEVKGELSNIKGALTGVNDKVSRVGRGMRNAGGMLSAGLTAPIAGLALLSKSSTDSIVGLQDMARVAGISTQRFFEVSTAAKQYGIEQDKVSDILKDANDKLGDFFQTGAGPLADFFEKIAPKVGVTADSFRGLSSDQALGLYISSLEKAGVSQQAMTFYMEALASGSVSLVEVYRNSGAAIDDASAAAARFGLELDDGAIDKARQARSDLSLLGSVIKTKLQGSLVEIMPAFTDMANAALPAIESIMGKIGEGVHWFNSLSPAVKKNIALFGGLAAASGPLIAGLGMVAMGASALLSPIGLVVGGVAALAAGGVLLARNWDAISAKYPAVTGAIEKVGARAKDVGGQMLSDFKQAGGQFLGALEALFSGDVLGALGGFKDTAITLIAAPFKSVDALLGGFSGKVSAWGGQLLADLAQMWQGVKADTLKWVSDFDALARDIISGFISSLKESWSSLRSSVLDIGGDMVDGFKEGISAKWNGLKEWGAKTFRIFKRGTQEAAQSNSPSRVMMALGGDVIDGFRIGIENGAPSITGALSGLSEGVEALKSQFGSIGDAVAGSMSQVGTLIGEGIRGLKDWDAVLSGVLGSIGQALFSSGLSSFGGAVSGALGPGAGNFMTGLLGGLGSVARTVPVGVPSATSSVTSSGASARTASARGRAEAVHVTFAPQIDARGADASVVARLEAALARSQAEFDARVVQVVQRARSNRVLS